MERRLAEDILLAFVLYTLLSSGELY